MLIDDSATTGRVGKTVGGFTGHFNRNQCFGLRFAQEAFGYHARFAIINRAIEKADRRRLDSSPFRQQRLFQRRHQQTGVVARFGAIALQFSIGDDHRHGIQHFVQHPRQVDRANRAIGFGNPPPQKGTRRKTGDDADDIARCDHFAQPARRRHG